VLSLSTEHVRKKQEVAHHHGKRSAISLGIPMRLADATSSLRDVVEERRITAVMETRNLKNIMTPKSAPSPRCNKPEGQSEKHSKFPK